MEKKSVAKNSIFNVIYRGVSTLFPLISMAFVSRALLPEGVGKVTYANTVVSYFTLIASLGIPNYGIKAIASVATNNNRSKTFFELFTINFISTLLCTIAYYFFVNTFPYFEGRRLLFNITGISLILNLLNVDWFYQGIEEYRMISIRGITVRTISLILIVVFIHKPSDYLKYALILTLGTAGNNIYNTFLLRKYVSFQHYRLEFRKHMKPVLILLASTIATEVYTMLDTTMLEYFHGDKSVGYYSNAVKIVRAIYFLTIAIATPVYPRISAYLHNKEKEKSNDLLNSCAAVIYIIAVPATVGIITTSYRIIPLLYGDAFFPASYVAMVLGILIVVFSTAYLWGHIVLMATANENKILRATIMGACTNVILNTFLIPSFKEIGAAIASVGAEVIVTTILIYYARQYYTVRINKPYIISLITSVTVMTAANLIVCSAFSNGSIQTIAVVLVSVSVYATMLFITKNSAMERLIYIVGLRKKSRHMVGDN